MIIKSGSLDMGNIRFRQMSPFVEYIADGITRYSKPATAKKEAEGRFYTLLGFAKRKKYVFYTDDIVLMLAIDYIDNNNGTIINVTVKNNGDSDINLKKIGLASINHVDYIGDSSEWVLTGIGNAHINAPLSETVSNVSGKTSLRRFKDIASLCDSDGNSVVLGAYGNPESDLIFDFDVINGTISLNIYGDMSGVKLESGETRDGQSVIIMQGNNRECLEKLSDALVKTHGSRTSKSPLCGWTSKYCLGNMTNEEFVKNTVNNINKQYGDTAINLIMLDDGYLNDNLEHNFENGIAKSVNFISQNGFIAGISLSPLYVENSLGMRDKNPEMFQRDKKGNFACVAKNAEGNLCTALDPTHPESVKYISNVVKQKSDNGFAYLKFDNNDIGSKTVFYDNRKTRLQVMRDLFRLYRSILGESAYIFANTNEFSRGIIGHADICRCGYDSCPKQNNLGETGAVWENGDESSMKNAIKTIGIASAIAGKFFSNDADIVFLENASFKKTEAKEPHTTADEVVTWNTFAGISGSSISISHQMQCDSSMYPNLLADIMNPPYNGGAFCAKSGYDTDCTQYGYYWDRSFGISSTFMIWNNSDRIKKINISKVHTTSLGGEYHLWSFWDRKYLGKGQENAEKIPLNPHGCMALKATVISDDIAPAFIGSTLHISMGAAEVDNYIFGKGGCKFVLNTNGSSKGELYVFSKKPLKITEKCNLEAEITESEKNVYRITVANRSKTEKQIIKLEY